NKRIRFGICDQSVEHHIGCWRRSGDDANALILEPLLGENVSAIQTAARLEHQCIGGPGVWVRDLNDVVALWHAHDDVAFVKCEGFAHKAGRIRIPGERNSLSQFLREQLGYLVLKPGIRSVRIGQVVGVGTYTIDLRVNELKGSLGLRHARSSVGRSALRRRSGYDEHCRRRANRKTNPETLSARHRSRLSYLPPRHLFSASSTAFGLSSCFAGRPRGTASLARARE